MIKITKDKIVKVLDLREMNSNYDFRELQPYIGRVGVVQFVDEDQEEASVQFVDYFNDEHDNAPATNWFPINQLVVAKNEDISISRDICGHALEDY